jgi:hypothetical protein
MATLTWVYQGLDNICEYLTNNLAPGNGTFRLYTNNHAVAIGDDKTALTECVLVGYAAVPFVAANWSVPAGVGLSATAYPAVTWTFAAYAGGTTIQGCYVLDAAGLLIFGGLLDTPFPVPPGGGSLTLTLTIQVDQEE